MKAKTHLGCSDCGSSDALTDYGTHTHCFSCGLTKRKNTNELNSFPTKEEAMKNSPDPVRTTIVPIDLSAVKALDDRAINLATAKFYNVWIHNTGDRFYPLFSLDCKTHKANQIQTVGSKGFLVQGDYNKTALFGQQLFPAGSARQITITEGFNDAMATYQLTGSKYPSVAVKSVSTARKDVADNYEYLNSFEKIVICFDNDGPGQKAAQEVAQMFALGKVRLITLRKAKDANDYLKNGWVAEFQKEWWEAPEWTPVGLKKAKDLWEEVKAYQVKPTVLYPWDGLNELTYGMRLSELVLWTADTGTGKSSVMRELEHRLLTHSEYGVGILHLEESNRDTLLGLMSITANKPLHLPDVIEQVTEEDLLKYFITTCNNDRVIVWDHFGSNSIEGVLQTIRHMVALGCKYIILDHLSIVVSDQSGDERKQLDEISTKLKTLTMELDIHIDCVIHINRQGQVRGSAGPEQVSNIIIFLERDKLSEDDEIRNTTKLIVKKNRFCGRTGPACYLKYDAETGRLAELPKEDWKRIENKEEKIEEW